jgi:hypothetical protein
VWLPLTFQREPDHHQGLVAQLTPEAGVSSFVACQNKLLSLSPKHLQPSFSLSDSSARGDLVRYG